MWDSGHNSVSNMTNMKMKSYFEKRGKYMMEKAQKIVKMLVHRNNQPSVKNCFIF